MAKVSNPTWRRLTRPAHGLPRKRQMPAAEDKAREGKLKTVVRTIQDKEIGRKRPTDELRADLAELTSVGRDLEQEGQSLSDDDLKNFNRCLIRLRRRLPKDKRACGL